MEKNELNLSSVLIVHLFVFAILATRDTCRHWTSHHYWIALRSVSVSRYAVRWNLVHPFGSHVMVVCILFIVYVVLCLFSPPIILVYVPISPPPLLPLGLFPMDPPPHPLLSITFYSKASPFELRHHLNYYYLCIIVWPIVHVAIVCSRFTCRCSREDRYSPFAFVVALMF